MGGIDIRTITHYADVCKRCFNRLTTIDLLLCSKSTNPARVSPNSLRMRESLMYGYT